KAITNDFDFVLLCRLHQPLIRFTHLTALLVLGDIVLRFGQGRARESKQQRYNKSTPTHDGAPSSCHFTTENAAKSWRGFLCSFSTHAFGGGCFSRSAKLIDANRRLAGGSPEGARWGRGRDTELAESVDAGHRTSPALTSRVE